jgi:Zn-dependent protease
MFESFDIAMAIVWYAVLLVSFVFHEAAHGFAALKLGDPTAYHNGQVTLDPVPHIRREPFGMVVMPIISYILAGFMIGWASAPYDPYWARAHRKRAALMAMAGPASNLALVLVAALAIRVGIGFWVFHAPDKISFVKVAVANAPGLANSAVIVISILFSLNLLLTVFNLIPLPPLDGSNVLMFFLKGSAVERYDMLLSQPGFRIIGLIVAWRMLNFVYGPIHLLAINLLYPGASYG